MKYPFAQVQTREGPITWFQVVTQLDEDDEPYTTWVNHAGGHWGHRRAEDKVLTIVEAESFDDLDWSASYPKLESDYAGWLAPDGTYHRCHSEDHKLYARFMLRMSEEDLDREGWVKVKNSTMWINAWSMTDPETRGEKGFKRLTKAQKDVLDSLGHTYTDDD